MLVLKKIVMGLLLLVVVLVVVGFFLPRKVHVERSIVVDAPQATVFALVNGFRSFNKWSPWYGLDPGATYTFEGPREGVGAKMSWAGDPKKVGTGSQEILESNGVDSITTSLDFGMEGKATSRTHLSLDATGTKVVWGFDTDLGMSPLSRYFGLMFDRMIGSDYEKGLANLKKLAESLPKLDLANLAAEEVTVEPVSVAYVSTSSTTEAPAIAAAIGAGYGQVATFMSGQGLKQAGAPRTINTKWAEGRYEFEAAIPLDRDPASEPPAGSPVRLKKTYSGAAIKVVHKGSYRDLPGIYDRLYSWLSVHGYEQNGPPWDEYVSDPGNTPESELLTHVFVPVKS